MHGRATEQTIAAQARAEKSKLKKVMGPRDLVLFYIACIAASMRVVALSTENGPSVLVLWVLGFVLFYVPLAFTTVELTSQGSRTRAASTSGYSVPSATFHGFITAWFYWATILVYFPAALMFSATNAAFVIPQWSHLAERPGFLMAASLGRGHHRRRGQRARSRYRQASPQCQRLSEHVGCPA